MPKLREKSFTSNSILLLMLFVLLVALPASIAGEGFNIVADELADMIYMLAGDIDLDGEVDLIYSGWFDNAEIVYGEGGGMFETATTTSFPPQTNFAFGYINSDKRIDIIGQSLENVYILINGADRLFSTITYPHQGGDINFISTGYFNRDPFLDFICAPGSIFLGTGSGQFNQDTNFSFTGIEGADVSDFNLDGYDDLVVLKGTNAFMLINDGDGNFSQSDSLNLGQLAISVSTNNALADFNNDGRPDFALITPQIGQPPCSAGYFYSIGTVALGDGAGGIAATQTFDVCGTAYNMVTADVNNDNELDIVVANGSFKRLEVILGNGDGTFQQPERFPVGAELITFVLATNDLDHDGNPDFVTNGSLSLSEQDSIYTALNDGIDKPVISGERMVTTGYSSVDFAITNPEGHVISRLKNTVAGSAFDRRDNDADSVLDAQAIDNSMQYGEYAIVFKRRLDITSPATFDADINIENAGTLRLFRNHETPGTAKSSNPDDSLVFKIAIEEFPSVSPASGRTDFGREPRFTWGPLYTNKDIVSFEFQLDSDFSFGSPEINKTGLTSPVYYSEIALDRDAVYYWRVRSFDGSSYSEWSNTFAVYIGPFFCGDVNNDNTDNDIVDLNYLVNHVFRSGPQSPSPQNADLNGDGDPGNLLDLNFLVNFMWRNGQQPMCGI